ncbi:MAG: HAMP domain-containing histidine kinase [Muribaculaceae bacterium]|nr:HAMP domain-containing histidine kinase [Muribaculaceae bacterium]
MFRFKISYSTKLFLLIVAILTICEVAFLAFQFSREQRYREDMLNAQLTVLNYQLLDHYEGGLVDVETWERTIDLPIQMLQLAIFDTSGNLIYDNTGIDIANNSPLELQEIKMAIESPDQKGFWVHNNDEEDDDDFYYYAALREGDLIARTGALGHDVGLSEFMRIDRSFLWYAFLIYVIIIAIAYYSTSRMGSALKRLSEFADKAEKGEEIYDTEAFPRNELGNIAHNIVLIYVRWQRTVAERDEKAKLALYEEQEKARLKRELTNNINHELKTPVSAISLELETLLAHKDRLSDTQRDMLISRCKANSDRLLKLIQDILTLNRLDDGADTIQRELLSLRDIVDESTDTLLAKAENVGIAFDVNLPETMMMLGNGPLLLAIFNNLINNAILYSGGSTISIFLQEEDENSYRIIIGDDGIGIGEEHLDHLFDRFYRIESGRSRKMGGTGIGLAIVKSAAKFHGGDITVRNLPSGGLEYTLTLSKGPKQLQ